MSMEEFDKEWFKNHSTEIIAASNLVLAIVTFVYVFISFNLSKSAEEQIILSSSPNIIIYYNYRPSVLSIKDSVFSFSIKNMSQTKLTNVSLRLQFYMYYLDSLQNEGYIEYRPSPSFEPDSVINELNSKSIAKLIFNLGPNYSSLASTEGYFYFKKSLDGEGHWRKMNLTKGKNFPFRFLIIEIIYYRDIDGEKFNKNYFFDISGAPFMPSDALLFQYSSLDELSKAYKRWGQGILERDDLFPKNSK